jgi:hypothetical protein
VQYLLGSGIIESSNFSEYALRTSTDGVNTALLYIGLWLFSWCNYNALARQTAATPSTIPESTAAMPTARNRTGKRRVLIAHPVHLVFLNLMLLGIGFQLLVPVIPEFFRVSMYFNYAMVLLIPNVLAAISDKRSAETYTYGVALFFIVQFIYFGMGANANHYRFFWEP